MNYNPKLVRFCVVGVLTALLQSTLLYAGVELAGGDSTIVSSLAFTIVVIFNYLMHYSWTFSDPAPHTQTLSRYLFMILFGFLINGSIMYVGVTQFDINYLLVQAVAFFAVIAWNFSIALLWVFRS
ncbi:MAG: putative flippase GtrA [Halioglobus sp.]|jgi:putative flippase GtrA